MKLRLLFEAHQNKGKLDSLSWSTLGVEYASILEEEIAFECFHMAHLLDHKKLKTNS